MAEETKKYLIDIESNLKKYADEAAEAKKKIDELKAANEALKQSGKENTAEYQTNAAELKNAQKEYKNLQKVVQDQLILLNKESTYREKLIASKTIEIQKLKDLGNGYIKNAQGMDIINPKYIEAKKRIGDINKAIIENDLSMNSGTTNVGRYGESIKVAFTSAGKSILSMVSPMALITAGIAATKKIFDGLKDAVVSTTGAINALNIASAMTKQLFYDITINGRLSVDSLAKVAEAASELNKVRTTEVKETFEISKLNREEQALRDESIDRTKTHAERLELLNKVKELESKKTLITVEHLKEELAANIKIMEQRPKDEEQRRKVWEIMTKINDAYAQEDVAMRRVEAQRTGFIQEALDARQKQFDAYMAEIEKTNEANDKARAEQKAQEEKDEIERLKRIKKQIEDERKEREKAGVDEMNRLAKEYEDRQKLKERDTEAGFEYQRLKAGENIDLLQQILDAEYGAMLASVEYKNLTTNEKLLIDQQYTQASKDLSEMRTAQQMMEVQLIGDLAGSLSGLFGRQTIANKALAVSQALINTYLAGVKAMAELPPNPIPGLRLLTMAAVIAAGLLQVKNILAVKVPGGGGGGGEAIAAPTSIVSTVPAQRTFSTPVGSTILTQPQLSQTQLNALPVQGLTADDIANAVSKLPAPRVSVEDINARIDEVNKVKVRSNI